MKLSICNELFGNIPFEKQCDMIAAAGFDGVEIAPFTVETAPWFFSTKTAAKCKAAIQNSGLAFAGLHWLMTKPDGLHITSADKAKRSEAVDHVKRLLDFAENLGGGCLIFGSPKARNAVPPVVPQEAENFFVEALSTLAPFARAANSVICVESLGKSQSNIINTLAEARRVVRTVNDKGISSMFDFHNTENETQNWEFLVQEYADIISHVHINSRDGTWPRLNELAAFKPAIQRLIQNAYAGWLSLEIFTKPQNPVHMLNEVKQFIEQASLR